MCNSHVNSHVNSHIFRTYFAQVVVSSLSLLRGITRPVLPSQPPVPRVPSTGSGARYDLRRPRWLSLSKPPLDVVLLKSHPSGVNDLSVTSGNAARCRSGHFNRTFLISIQLPRPSATPSFQEGELGLRLSVAACAGAQVTILLYLCRLVRIESL